MSIPPDPSYMPYRKQYTYYRKLIGSRRDVAELMGITQNTIRCREQGRVGYKVKQEHVLAMRYIAWLVGYRVDHKLPDLSEIEEINGITR